MYKKLENKLGIFSIIIIIPLLFSFLFSAQASAAESFEVPAITSEAAILIEEGSGRVLYEKNADLIMYPASLTKIATAIYALEKGNLEDIVTVSEKARNVDGTRVYLEIEERVPLKKLIQGLLINSGNDAGVAIAEHLDGTEERFSTNINAYLQEIGLKDTTFVNPHGLFDPNHTATAKDLALLTQYAMKNATFREIFGTVELEWDGEGWETTIYNHHKMMRERPYEGITGGKNGYVNQSGQTLVTTAKRGDLSLIAVVLKGQTHKIIYGDTEALLDYGFTNFKMVTLPKGKQYGFEEKKFVTTESHSFPILHDEVIIEEITNEGILEIKNEDDETLVSFGTSEIFKPKETEQQPEIERHEGSSKNNMSLTLFIPIMIGIFVIIRMRRKEHRLRKI